MEQSIFDHQRVGLAMRVSKHRHISGPFRSRRNRRIQRRRLSVERLESRSMLAADILSPPPGMLTPAPEGEFLAPPIANPVENSFDSIDNVVARELQLELGGQARSAGEHFQVGETLYLQIHLGDLYSSTFPDTVLLNVQFDPQFVRVVGPIRLQGVERCGLGFEMSSDELVLCLGRGGADDGEAMIEVPLSLVGAGQADISVGAVLKVAEDSAGAVDVKFLGSAQILVSPDPSTSPTPYGPPDADEFVGKGTPFYLVRQPESQPSNAGTVLRVRPSTPRVVIATTSAADLFATSISIEDESHAFVSESGAKRSRHGNELRPLLDWNLSDDASANLFQSLEVSDSDSLESDNSAARGRVLFSDAQDWQLRSSRSSRHEDQDKDARENDASTAEIATEMFFSQFSLPQLQNRPMPESRRVEVLTEHDYDAVLALWFSSSMIADPKKQP